MPSKNRSDKGDKTVKVSVNQRKEKSRNPSNLGGFGMVPVVGLEPTRCRQQRILSPPRLPIPTHRQEFSSKITTPEIGGHFGGQTSKIKDIQFSKAQINRAVPASEREMTHWILSPARLPIPSFRRMGYCTTGAGGWQEISCRKGQKKGARGRLDSILGGLV